MSWVKGEPEVLAVLLFHAARVFHQLLDHVPVHQRLAAEEVDLQVAALAGMLDKEIQRALAHLKAHQRAVAVVLALAGEAVGAVQVAGVRDVQAQRLDHVAGALLEGAGHRREGIRGEELAARLERRHVADAKADVLLGHVLAIAVFGHHGRDDLVRRRGFKHRDDVVGHVVHGMDGAGAGIQHDVVAVELVLMKHVVLQRS